MGAWASLVLNRQWMSFSIKPSIMLKGSETYLWGWTFKLFCDSAKSDQHFLGWQFYADMAKVELPTLHDTLFFLFVFWTKQYVRLVWYEDNYRDKTCLLVSRLALTNKLCLFNFILKMWENGPHHFCLHMRLTPYKLKYSEVENAFRNGLSVLRVL